MNYVESIDFLHQMPAFSSMGTAAFKPGFERILALLDSMGAPQNAYPIIHIAGTNGKGSTASMVAAIATAAGRKTGLHTSPHLTKLNERMRLDGVPAPDAWLAQQVTTYQELFNKTGPSFFEATVALSLLYFAHQRVNLAVIEVGLGGRLDATNIVRPEIAVITHIGLDHTAILGDTLEAIAREKGGIIKQDTPVVSNVSQEQAHIPLRQLAQSRNAPFHDVGQEVAMLEEVETSEGWRCTIRTPLRTYTDLLLPLPGRHQLENLKTAVRAVEISLPEVVQSEIPVKDGLASVHQLSGLKGRLEYIRKEPGIVLDVGHNSEGLSASLSFLKKKLNQQHGRLYVAFSAKKDKDLSRMLAVLSPLVETLYLVPFDDIRSAPISDLASMGKKAGTHVSCVDTVEDAVNAFLHIANPWDVLLITGSHQIVASYLNTYQLPADDA